MDAAVSNVVGAAGDRYEESLDMIAGLLCINHENPAAGLFSKTWTSCIKCEGAISAERMIPHGNLARRIRNINQAKGM